MLKTKVREVLASSALLKILDPLAEQEKKKDIQEETTYYNIEEDLKDNKKEYEGSF